MGLRRRMAIVALLVSAGAWLLAAAGASAMQLQDGEKLSLAGDWKMKPALGSAADLYRPEIEDSSWKQIAVPANWHLAGQDMEGSVWFRRHFRLPAASRGKQIQLVFEAVDYAADVWLNGEYLGFHQGYFEPFRFEVAGKVAGEGGENLLAVLVHSPSEPYGSVWSLHKTLIKGVFGQHDTRPGGAWSPRGQEQNTGGIWAPVYLRVSRQVSIESLQAIPQPADSASASGDGGGWEVPVVLGIFTARQAAREVELEVRLEPFNFVAEADSGGAATATVRLPPGQSLVTIALHSSNTRLWSSWDRGQPNLYRLQVRILAAGRRLDEIERTLGFRTIAVDPLSKQWMLNGRRIFLRGTNYISTQWLSEMTAEKYDFDVALMKRANINAVRVHAHIEAADFYRACDEAGILIWQDFPLQWGYSEDAEFEKEATRQALAMVSVLGGHAAIIGWSLHNEPPWDAAWMQYKYKDYEPQQNKRLDDALYAAVSQADPTRYTHAYSSTAEHPWLGWYSGVWQDYAKPAREAFITEFGAQALPDLAALKKIFAAGDLWPDTADKWEVWDYHNFEKHEAFDIAHIAPGASIEEFIRNTQQYQARLTSLAAESYRRQRFQPVTAIFQFMLVEDWPSVNWGILDYWRNPKPGYAALATAYQPVLPSIAWEKEVWRTGEKVALDLWIVNDTLEAFPGSRMKASLQTAGAAAREQSVPVDIEADSSRNITTLSWPNLPRGSYVLWVQIEDSDQAVLGRNSYSFQVVE